MIKMYAIFARETLALFEGNEGKLAAQAGHAYLHAYWDAEDRWGVNASDVRRDLNVYGRTVWDYRNNDDARKIALIVNCVSDLRFLENIYRPICGVSLVEDCGYTIFKHPTITCLGIGPLDDEHKEKHLAGLGLLRHELYAN